VLIAIDQPASDLPASDRRHIEADGLRLRVLLLAHVWSRFGFFLLPRRKKVLEYDLAEHAADLFSALAAAESPHDQDRLILRFTLGAVAKVFDHTRVALQGRILDQFDWVVRRLSRD
jgi:hypothetical protein